MAKHNPRCAIFDWEPGLRDDKDCNCGAIPPLPQNNEKVRSQPKCSDRNCEREHDLAGRHGKKEGQQSQGWALDKRGQLDTEIEAEKRKERDAIARRLLLEQERRALRITDEAEPGVDRYDPNRC